MSGGRWVIDNEEDRINIFNNISDKLTVTPIPAPRKRSPMIKQTAARFLAYSGPTDELKDNVIHPLISTW